MSNESMSKSDEFGMLLQQAEQTILDLENIGSDLGMSEISEMLCNMHKKLLNIENKFKQNGLKRINGLYHCSESEDDLEHYLLVENDYILKIYKDGDVIDVTAFFCNYVLNNKYIKVNSKEINLFKLLTKISRI